MQRKGTCMRILAILIAICTCIVYSGATHAQTPDVLMLGDANCDGKVNTSDAVQILKECAKVSELDFYGSIAADINVDNSINTADAVGLLKTIVSEDDALQPIEKMGDLSRPVFYADLDYLVLSDMEHPVLVLSEYTAPAVEAPGSPVAFGCGYMLHLTEGKDYVFETCSAGGADVDTKMYLIDSANNVFLTDDNSGDGKFSRIEFHVWEGGIYKLLVTGNDGDDVGSCVLSYGEHMYLEPTEAPTVTPTATPTITPTATPTAEPTVSCEPVEGIVFINRTVPEEGAVVQYKMPYTLKGTISADEAIVKVRAEVQNRAGEVEKNVSRTISADLDLKRYSLTDGGATSIDGKLHFSELIIGTKTFKLYCTLKGEQEKLIFSSNFYVGATDDMLSGNAYAGSAALSSGVRQEILDYINDLDEDSDITRVIMEGIIRLGISYGTGSGQLDCSSFVQAVYNTVGVNLPRTAAEQGRYCYNLHGEISKNNVRTGDLVFFRSTGCNCGRYKEIHHVAIFLGPVDGVKYYLEASSGKHKIVLRRAWGDGDTSGWDIEFYGRPY
ncbi:MAG: C40 family peptidase [Clostridia bacterium]|nr:C40 family peptidase [Clostridia bacterium]